MDTQLNNYVIYKNGEPLTTTPVTLDKCVKAIQVLEMTLDRLTQHSPYTIRKSNGS